MVWILPASPLGAQETAAQSLRPPAGQVPGLRPSIAILLPPADNTPAPQVPLRAPLGLGHMIPDVARIRQYTQYLELRFQRAATMQLPYQQGGLAHPEDIRAAPEAGEPMGYMLADKFNVGGFRRVIERDFPELRTVEDLLALVDLRTEWSGLHEPAAELSLPLRASDEGPPAPPSLLPGLEAYVQKVSSLWRQEIVRGYADLRIGEYISAENHFLRADRVHGPTYHSDLGLFHSAFALGHHSQAAYRLRGILRGMPHHFSSTFEPEQLFDSPTQYYRQVRRMRERIGEGDLDPNFLAAYAYATWFSGRANRRMALEVAKQPSVERLLPRMWRVMEAVIKEQLVGDPRVGFPIPGIDFEQPTGADSPGTARGGAGSTAPRAP